MKTDKKLVILFLLVLIGQFHHVQNSFAQATAPSYDIDPFAEEEPSKNLIIIPAPSAPGDVMSLFGPTAIVVTATPAPQWQDLGATVPLRGVAPNTDTYNDRVNDVVNKPLPKRKPFGDPLDSVERDISHESLFGVQ